MNKITVVGIIVFLIALIFFVHWSHQEGIKSWAAQNNFAVESVEVCHFDKGPYMWVGEDTTVYYITVRDNEKRKRIFYGYFGLAGFETSEKG